MSYSVEFTTTALRQFQKLDNPVKRRIVAVLERVRVRPDAFVVKLADDPGYKLRVGDYRLILDIDRGRLLVLVIYVGHRSTVYARRKRRE